MNLFRFNQDPFRQTLNELEKMREFIYSSYMGFDLNLGSENGFPKKDDPAFTYSEEKIENKTATTLIETWKSGDGSSTFSRTTVSPKEKEETQASLKEKIKAAVKAEDYETAAKLKKQLEKTKKED